MITKRKKNLVCTKSLIVHFGNTKRESIRARVTAVHFLQCASRSVSQSLHAQLHFTLEGEGKGRERKKKKIVKDCIDLLKTTLVH